MNCPQCDYPNIAGATYCQLCHEVFNRSAADRYIHAQRRARMQQNPGYVPPGSSSGRPSASPLRDVREFLSEIDWSGFAFRTAHAVQIFFQHYAKQVVRVAAVVALGSGILFFTSEVQRVRMFGSRLDYAFSSRHPVAYSVGFHTELKSWSERSGRLDTPLETLERNEFGNVKVNANKPDRKTQKVIFQPTEWILTQTGQVSQNLPPNHPSLKTGAIVLNPRGQIINRINAGPTRMGRALAFLAPRWPTGSQHVGAHWDEPTEWVDFAGPWKIFWKGKLHWTVAGVETWTNMSCLHLTYTADVKPTLWEPPDWARGGVKNISFQGTTSGDACVDRSLHQVFSNDFVQEGTLRVPIDNIYRIPMDLRVGRTPRHRWGTPAPSEPGTIILQIKNRLGIHKS